MEEKSRGRSSQIMKSQFLAGARRSIPILISTAPFGLLYGAIAVDQGLTVWQACLMSLTIYAGASQLVGIDLFRNNAAPWIVILSIFIVNVRHLLYSAAVGRRIGHFPFGQQVVAFFFLIDPQFVETERKGERDGHVSFAWYMGLALPVSVLWNVESLLGALFGKLIPNPDAFGIDFLLPLYFFGMVMSFRMRQLWLPVVAVAGIASVVALKTVGSPLHVSIGALTGVIFAAVFTRPEAKA
jgi:4-azaleucine resistance transporter AzlC